MSNRATAAAVAPGLNRRQELLAPRRPPSRKGNGGLDLGLQSVQCGTIGLGELLLYRKQFAISPIIQLLTGDTALDRPDETCS